jgi:c-di-GMP-binding flagellar brake protein YcgR
MRTNRDFTRRPSRHTVKIHCQVVRERDFTLVADTVENLSTWGMLVTPSDPVMTGEKVFVSFCLPGAKNEWIDACATVKRVVHGRRPNDTTRKLGLEFDDLRPYDRYRIRRALAKRPMTPPGARPGRRQLGFPLELLAA